IPPQSLAPSRAAVNSVSKTFDGSTSAPRAPANSANSPTHAFSSLAPLLQWTMATGSPAGVVTRSSSRCTRASSRSSTTMAKMLVPAETLPVRGATELVATMPVPASPSGGHIGMPGSSRPLGSSCFAPAGVSSPAGPPDHGQQIGQGQVGAGLGSELVEPAQLRRVVITGGGVDGEHAAGVADAQNLLSGELPVDVAGQRREMRDPA